MDNRGSVDENSGTFFFATSNTTDLKKYKSIEIYDKILLGIYKHEHFRNQHIFIGEDILFKKENIWITQHELEDFLEDFEYDGLIRNKEQKGSDYTADLTSKTKNILDEHKSYSKYLEYEKRLKYGKKLTIWVQNIFIVLGFGLGVLNYRYQVKKIDGLEYQLQHIELMQSQQQTQVINSNQILKYLQLNKTDTITVLYLQDNLQHKRDQLLLPSENNKK